MRSTQRPLVCTPGNGGTQDADDTPEYPLSAPIKPDDPERRSEQSQAETEGCAPEAESDGAERDPPV